jgi:hypothetical protein
VRLPWLTCQKQAPSEAAVLQQVKSLVGRRGQQQGQQAQPQQGHQQQGQQGRTRVVSPVSHASNSTLGSPAGSVASSCSGGSVTSPVPGRAAAAAGAAASAGPAAGAGPEGAASGPLLLFPDTSALLSMIGSCGGAATLPCCRHRR